MVNFLCEVYHVSIKKASCRPSTPFLADIARTVEPFRFLSFFELREIRPCNIFERQIKLCRNLRDIPQHVAELSGYFFFFRRRYFPAVIAKNFLHFIQKFPRLPRKPDDRIDKRLLYLRI